MMNFIAKGRINIPSNKLYSWREVKMNELIMGLLLILFIFNQYNKMNKR